MSRRLPHFNRESLEKSLPEAGVKYVWMKGLGGRRKKIRNDSPNVALRSPSFRNYADYMLTAEFQHAVADLITMAEHSRTAYMCAERVYFRCHRMLVSDWLVAHGHAVLHIEFVRSRRTLGITLLRRTSSAINSFTSPTSCFNTCWVGAPPPGFRWWEYGHLTL